MSDQENISRFCDITGASVETAQQFLEVNILMKRESRTPYSVPFFRLLITILKQQ